MLWTPSSIPIRASSCCQAIRTVAFLGIHRLSGPTCAGYITRVAWVLLVQSSRSFLR
jgi:hypothetical protein